MDPTIPSDFSVLVTDPELLADAMRGAELKTCQLSKRPSSSDLRRMVFASSCLDMARFGPAMLFTGSTPANCYTLMYILDCPEAGHSFNFSIDHHEDYLALFPPDADLDSKTPRDYRVAILTVEAESFLSTVRRLYPDLPDPFLSKSVAMRMETTSSTELRSLLELAWKLSGRGSRSRENEVARGFVEGQLLEAFLRLLNEGHTHPVPPPGNGRFQREKKFRKIRDYLAEHLDQPVGLPELCFESGLSPRAVEDLFHDYFGIGPNLYFRHQRLHAARSALSAHGSVESGIVKRIALEHGFWHLGRFSKYYSDLFGEKPSATLTRAGRGDT